jgi:hypothetical protein
MKPFIHAKSSAKRYGGVPEDYLEIHDFMDSSKAHIPDVRHRAIFHSSLGCYIVEKVFGVVRINSAGKEYSVRDVAEDHIIEDLGYIPTVQDYFQNMTIQPWMGGRSKKTKKIEWEDDENKWVVEETHTITEDQMPSGSHTIVATEDLVVDGGWPREWRDTRVTKIGEAGEIQAIEVVRKSPPIGISEYDDGTPRIFTRHLFDYHPEQVQDDEAKAKAWDKNREAMCDAWVARQKK